MLFAFSYVVPNIGSDTYAVVATDASSNSASANFTIGGTAIAITNNGPWNVASTWKGSAKTGTITTTASTSVTGSATLFLTQLAQGDAIYRSDGTTLIGTVASITSNTSLTLTANAASNNSDIAYAGSRVPGVNDDVFIQFTSGGANITVTIPAGYTGFANSLTLGAATNDSEMLSFAGSTSTLTVSGNVVILGPTAGATRDLQVNAGTLTVGGNLSLGDNQTGNQNNRVTKVTVTTGTVNVSGNLTYNNIAGSDPLQTQIVMSGGAGTFNLGGTFTINNNSGTLTPGTTSTFNYNGTSTQTIPIGVSNVVYHSLSVNNTSSAGATLSAAITAANVTGSLRVQSGTLSNGGFAIAGGAGDTFQVAANAAFKVGGTTSGFPTGYATFSVDPASTVSYEGSGAQTLANATSYGNLSVGGGNTKTAAGALTVNGNLTIGSSTTFGASTFSHAVKGNFTNNGTFTANTSTTTFSGSSAQTIGGSSTTTFNNLTIGNAVSLNGVDINVGGTLALGSSVLSTGSANKVTLTAGTTPTRTTGFVDGAMQRPVTAAGGLTFAVGNGTNDTHVDMTFASGSSGTFTVRSTAGENPNTGSGIDQSKDVNTYWTFGSTGTINFPSSPSVSAVFTYPSSNVDAGATASSFVVKRWNGSTWSSVTVSGTPSSTSTSVTGLTAAALGQFVIGNP